MLWINKQQGFLQLDVVGFLAILGESSVLASAQEIAMSNLSYLPRLLPAPQAFFRTHRPTSLPASNACVSSVEAGNFRPHMHHIASLVLYADMDPFTVRCVNVDKRKNWPPVRANPTGPLLFVSLLGCATSIALLVTSAALNDGASMVATLLLSFLSPLAGVVNRWRVELPQVRGVHQELPKADLVVRYPNGSFLVVKCQEDVARELYFAPEEIKYMVSNARVYQLVSLCGTTLLMIGVIFLANASTILQICWAVAFIFLNAAYWLAAALPRHMHWDFSCFEIQEHGVSGGPVNGRYTEALWKTILLTQSSAWTMLDAAAVPRTEAWNEWLLEATAQARLRTEVAGKAHDALWEPSGSQFTVPVWDAHGAFLTALRRQDNAIKALADSRLTDEKETSASQVTPLREKQMMAGDVTPRDSCGNTPTQKEAGCTCL